MTRQNDDTTENPGTEDDGGDESDDEFFDRFSQEWETIKEKVGRIPDDISERLDEISGKISSGGGNKSGSVAPPESRRAPSTRAPARQSQQAEIRQPEPEKKPKPQHWYYRSRKRDE